MADSGSRLRLSMGWHFVFISFDGLQRLAAIPTLYGSSFFEQSPYFSAR